MPLSRSSESSRPVALWLFAIAALVLAMVMVGGATRLTDSGLSITEWRPVTGAVPPLSQAAWQAEFARYQQIPEYRHVNAGMTLDGFKTIYWWEWSHRLLGRLIGLAFFLPFVFFLATRRMPRRLAWRSGVLLGLGALQGAVGWWMVASGLSERVDVAPERLAAHLGLAFVLFCLLVWTGLEAWFGQGRPNQDRKWHWIAGSLAGLVFVQVMLGALVAGNDAGLVFTDWPLMNGDLFPEGYAGEGGVLHSLLHSQAAVQFNHRIVAYLLTGAAVAVAVAAARSRRLAPASRQLAFTLAALVFVQAALGVATLMAQVPMGLALVHQLMAAIVLAFSVALAWRVRRA